MTRLVETLLAHPVTPGGTDLVQKESTVKTAARMTQSAVNHRRKFLEDGFTQVPGFFTKAEMDTLINDVRNADPKSPQPSELNKGQLLFYNNLFFRSERIQRFITQPRLIEFLREIIGPDFWVRWDQAVFKGPGAGEFPWHQDNAYNRLDHEHFQLWIALSKMNADRGGLWLVPGSHRNGLLPHTKIGKFQAYTGSTDNSFCVEAEVGDIVLFSSLMLHYTSPNVSNDDRWAYVVEYMSLDHDDPFKKPPFFIAARNGKSKPGFTRYPGGRIRVKYLMPVLKQCAQKFFR